MVTIDPREKLVQTGNELLDVIYWLSSHSEDARALVKRLDAATEEALTAAEPHADRPLIEDAFGLALEGMRMVAKRDDLAKQYTLLRSTIEAMEAGRVDLPDVG